MSPSIVMVGSAGFQLVASAPSNKALQQAVGYAARC
jgi:hypothetical protein